MTSVVPYFQVHQPYRLRRYTFFDIGCDDRWFDDVENRRILTRVAERCYVPANAALLEAVERTEGRFRCAFSVSGTALDQMEAWAPEALEGFVRLARTGCVEFLAETSHHSLAFSADDDEFRAQVRAQAERVERLFGRAPTTFRNTELVVSQAIARTVEDLGFTTIVGEGADHLLGWRSPGRVYGIEGTRDLRLLLRTYRFSDDIAFRFADRARAGRPLTPEAFAAGLHALPREEQVVGLFLDYETFGEHQSKETGIFEFLRGLPAAVLADGRFAFETPAEATRRRDPVARLSIPHPVSWADAERDLTAWLGNAMQREAHLALYALADDVRRSGRPDLLEAWRRLSTSDHLYYMCTKWFADGDVHKHFSPYRTPHDAFIAFMNVLDDLRRRAASAAASAAAPLPRPAAERVATTSVPPPPRARAERRRRRTASRRAGRPRGEVGGTA